MEYSAIGVTTEIGDGLRVLDLTDELAFQGARLLVGLGADVVRCAAASPDETRRAGELHWHSGKRLIDLPSEPMSALDDLAAGAHVVLESGPLSALRGITYDGETPRSRWPDAVHIVVTPFGLTGPRRYWGADDLVLSAAGGAAWLCGRRESTPEAPPREQALQLAGTHAAIGALLGVLAARRDGAGQLVDISAQEAVAATLETGAISWIHASRYPSRNGGVYEHVAHRVFPTADGFVAGGYSGSNRMWTDLVTWLVDVGEAEDLTDPRWDDAEYRWAHRVHVDAIITRFTRRRSAGTIAAEALRRGLPWAEVTAPAKLIMNPQLQARRFFTRLTGQEGMFDVGLPFEASQRPRPVKMPPPTTISTQRPWPSKRRWTTAAANAAHLEPEDGALTGLRVLDLTWVLAGPYATKALAEHGADVIKIESRHRQDPTRFAPSMRLRPGAGPDDSGYFLNFNHDKRSVALNLRTAEGQDLVRRLAAHCHVVVENFRPGVLQRWGMSYDDLKQLNPEIILVSMAGTGQTGPWRDAATFADTLGAMSGLTYETQRPGAAPHGLAFGLGDMVAGNAAVLGLLDRLVHGVGGHVDLSQLEAMVAAMGTTVLETQLGAAAARATAEWPNRHATRVPHGIYPTHGKDRWIAISVGSNTAWRALVQLAGSSELSTLLDSTLAERRDHEETIDNALRLWTRALDGQPLAERLQDAGIPAAVVATGEDLVEADPQLLSRQFYRLLKHPIAGEIAHEGPVIHPQRTPPRLRRAAPLLGEHTDEVLQSLLTMSNAEIHKLRAKGVLE